ncbi:MAG: rRNA pseudouridine synthase [Oscillospiraceae bacterium]|jgi:23S rRNA pseudouridine2605 synthase|nr:rRNA pseudouridine synthase [Oscillospiraceae bacterium]
MEKERIQKLISESGHCSRRAAEELIKAGAVKVNGRNINLGDKATKNDLITIKNKKLEFPQSKRYIKLYKPRGYTTSMADTHGKKLITELLKGIVERVYPAGRLDRDSEGLLLLSNDGNFTNDITHPSNRIKKKYRVTVPSIVSAEIISRLSAGVNIGENGEKEITVPCEIKVLAETDSMSARRETGKSSRTVLEFEISEGKNRQIRRMCKAVGLEVSRLKRTSVGGVKLGMLKPGEYADLNEKELKLLGVGAHSSRPQKKQGGKP